MRRLGSLRKARAKDGVRTHILAFANTRQDRAWHFANVRPARVLAVKQKFFTFVILFLPSTAKPWTAVLRPTATHGVRAVAARVVFRNKEIRP